MSTRSDSEADGYEILEHTRSGGMGAVYRAREIETGRIVALKVLSARLETVASRFAKEVELLSSLEHPNIIGYVGHGITRGGAPFLAMPWLEGEDLQTRLARGPLTVDETLALARAVAGALEHLHARGFVHRDLKPSNLFLPGGDLTGVKVIDLGIAHGDGNGPPLTLSGVLLGTPEFMAPEQARGERNVTPAADIFALGCVLFECLTGKRLFAGGHVMAVLGRILIEDAPRVREASPHVPRALDALVHAMVAKEPSARPRDGAALRARLEDVRRTPPEEGTSAPALTRDEQRVASVLVILQGDDEATGTRAETQLEGESLGGAAARFGVRFVSLGARTSIAVATGEVVGTDQAYVLARFARHVMTSDPTVTAALTTGTGLAGAKVPVGDAIDRGVAMARAARPNAGVHLDDATAALLGTRYYLRSERGGVVLDDERLSPDPTRPLLGRPTTCLGRDHELALLAAVFADCLDGAGPRVAQISAPAGTGKSRIRHELVRRLTASHPRPKILSCTGDPLTSSVPHAQVAQLLRRALFLRTSDRPEHVRRVLERHLGEVGVPGDRARIAAFLGELLDAPYPEHHDAALDAARHDADAMADQTRLALQSLLAAWCAKQPVILVLEDMHWADAPSLQLLDRALRALDGARLLVLAIMRPEGLTRFPKLWEHRVLTKLGLPPLAWSARLKMIHAAMGDDAPREAVLRIAELSEGNAFYLEELVRDAAQTSDAGLRARSSPLRPDDLPTTILAFAQTRLARIEPGARKLLRAASVFGETFPREGVRALMGEDGAEIASRLAVLLEDEAIAREEVEGGDEAAGEHAFTFRHGLLRSAAYASLTERDRVAAHRVAASWLKENGGDPEVVALHWLEAREPACAAATLDLAARQRWARSQAEAAARCATRALLLVGAVAGGGGAEEAEAAVARVRLLADALESAARLDAAEVMTGLEGFVALEPSVAESSIRILRFALDKALAGVTAAPLAARALALGACALASLSDGEGANERLARAAALGADDLETVQCIHFANAQVAMRRFDMKAVLDTLTSGVLPSEPYARIKALIFLAISSVSVGGPSVADKAFGDIARAAELGERLSFPLARALCAKAMFLVFLMSSRHAEAARASEEGVCVARELGLRYDECVHLHNAGEEYIKIGDRTRARAALAASDDLARDIGVETAIVHNEILLAYLDGAAEQLHALADRLQATNAAWHETHARYWLGLLYAEHADARARTELSRSRELADRRGVRVLSEDCARALGNLPAESG